MNILTSIILTLVVYSGIATILYLIFDKEDVLIYFGWGIVGFTVSTISFLSYLGKKTPTSIGRG